MKMLFLIIFQVLFFVVMTAQDQSNRDTIRAKELKEVIIRAWQREDIGFLPDEQGGFLNTGKKSEVLNLAATNANIAVKTGRQVFSKIPEYLCMIWTAAAIK